MKPRALLLTLLTLCTTPAPAADDKTTDTVRLVVHPAAAPVPAMKYRLAPTLVEQVPGNAALLYLTAAQQLAIVKVADPAKEAERIDALLAAPLATFPQAEAKRVLDTYASALNQMRLASLRDRCDFDTPFRTEGFRTLLPHLNSARQLAKLVALQARARAAAGDFDGAVASLRQGIVQARHLSTEPFLVQSLVAAAITAITLDQAREITQAAGAPNLYWALSELPSPMMDARAAMRFEHAGLYFSIPGLREAQAGPQSPEQWHAVLVGMITIQEAAADPGNARFASNQPKLAVTFLMARDLVTARKYLVGHGTPAKAAEQMPAPQALGLYYVAQYEEQIQGMEAQMSLPFPRAHAGLLRIEQAMKNDRALDIGPMAVLLPAVSRAYVSLSMVDRRIAMLRTVEAIRAYAAGHDARPPAALADLTDTPAPADPLTGKPFAYSVAGDVATIEAPPVEGAVGRPTGLRYEVRIVE